jgi:hypothetical protein
MKNKFTLFVVVGILLTASLGCSMLNPFSGSKDDSSRSSNSRTNDGGGSSDGSAGIEKVGIPECDEVIDMLTKEMESPDDGYISRAIKQTVYNSIRESLKKSIEEGKNDPKELAKKCSEFKENLIREKAKQDEKDAAKE